MSFLSTSVRSQMPDKLKKLSGILDKPKTDHATHPSNTPVWQFTKKNAIKFWSWLEKDNWKWVLATLIVAGIIHILAVLSLPSLAPKSAWFRLRNEIPVNQMQFLEKLDKKPPILPLMAPDVRYAICRYDLSQGPVTIRTQIPNNLFSIAAYNQLGQNFYVITGQALQRSNLYLVITKSKDTAEAEVSASEKSDDVVVINSKDTNGILLLRAPITGPAYEALTENLLSKATCTVEKQG